MGMQESLLWIGSGCMVAAVIGGGIKLAKMEIPQVTSVVRQILLFVVGSALLAGSFLVKPSSGTGKDEPPGKGADKNDGTRHDEPGPAQKLPARPAVRVATNPAALDFGDVAVDEDASEFVSVAVEGVEDKSWTFQSTGAFFKAKKTESGISVRLNTKRQGRYRGTLVISSNAGEAVVKVRASVMPGDRGTDDQVAAVSVRQNRPNPVDEPTKPARNTDIGGRWNLNGGIVEFSAAGHSGRYTFIEKTSAELLGSNIPIGQGSATVSGDEVTLTGQNELFGPWSAEVVVKGTTMSGTLQYFGNQAPIAMQRM
jgi:hypothetical protein